MNFINKSFLCLSLFPLYSLAQYYLNYDTTRKCFLIKNTQPAENLNPASTKKNSLPININNKIICVDSSLYVSSPISFQDCELKISPNVSIIVTPNSTLQILGSHLYACSDMWSGISLQNNAQLIIAASPSHPSSFIEDAIVAVNATGNGTLSSSTQFRISNSIFNRNYTDIFLHDYQLNITTYPFFITNNIFTCRDIPFTPNSLTWPSVAAVSASFIPSSPLQSPYINNATYSPTNTAAFLKPPFAGQKSFIGIRLENIGFTSGTFTIGGLTFRELSVGAPNSNNFFDNKVFGISAFNANFTSISNVYQNTIQTGKGGTSGSVGIYAKADNGIMGNLNINRIRVIPTNTLTGTGYNKFFDCSSAIKIENYSEIYLAYNDIRSTQVNTAPVSIINHPGQNGIACNTGKFTTAIISSNKIYNIEDPISFIASVVTSTSTAIPSQQRSGNLFIQNNTIQPHLPGYPITSQYISNAIYAASILLAAPQYSSIPTTSVNISGNTVSNAWRGIYTANWFKKDVQIQSNCITLSNDSYGNTQYGIQSANNFPLNSFGIMLYNNSVTGPASPSAKMKGIWVTLSTQNAVRCNTVNSVSNGIEYSSTSAPCQFLNNTIQNCTFAGYVLSNNAIIGPQGTTGQPSDNRWLGSFGFRTFMDASNALFSILYTRNNPPVYDPLVGSAGFANGGTPYGSPSSIIYTTGPFLPCPPIGPCNNIIPPPPIVIPIPPPFNNPNIPILEKIAQNQIPAFTDTATSRFISQNHLFRTLLATPSLTNNSAVLQQFLTQNQTSANSKDLFQQTESDIANANYTAANTKIAALSPQNTAEQNHKEFYRIYLNYLQQGQLNSNDSTNLSILANACPYKDGAVVYQARTLYNLILNTITVFEDNCSISANEKTIHLNNKPSDTMQDDVLLYPNPNDGNFIIRLNTDMYNHQVMQITIKDVSGKIISEQQEYVHQQKIQIKANLKTGIYLIEIKNQKQVWWIKKLVIE